MDEFVVTDSGYRLAAAAKHATATYELGTLYLEGHGVPRNDSKAASLIKEAAILGYSQAQSTLGMLYEAGECGLNENQAESLEWFIKAAQQGNPLAQLKVGRAYISGELLSLNAEKGIEYLTKAATQDDIDAISLLGNYYEGASDKVIENPEFAFQWHLKGARTGNARCECKVGYCYLRGVGIEKNQKEAATWFERAADKGYADAEFALGMMFLTGVNSERDIDKAKAWFTKAVAQSHSQAIEALRRIAEA